MTEDEAVAVLLDGDDERLPVDSVEDETQPVLTVPPSVKPAMATRVPALTPPDPATFNQGAVTILLLVAICGLIIVQTLVILLK